MIYNLESFNISRNPKYCSFKEHKQQENMLYMANMFSCCLCCCIVDFVVHFIISGVVVTLHLHLL